MGVVRRPLWERWIEKVQITDTYDCWLWTGSVAGGNQKRDRLGPYGKIRDENGIIDYAHRVALRLFGVVIPEGWHVHHRCEVRLCVNPSHLQAIESKKNLMLAAEKTNGARLHREVEAIMESYV